MLDSTTVPLEAVHHHPRGVHPRRRAWSGRTAGRVALVLAVALAAAAWLPFLHAPLTSDEGGFLLLARQWAPGWSLYGNYWVDRPPLLIWLFSLAGQLGPTSPSAAGVTAPAVKLLGAAASGVAVLFAGLLALRVAPDSARSRRWAVTVAVALVTSPLLGMPETDGEVLAVPLVLLGVLLLVIADRQRWCRRVLVLTAGAGMAAMSAALVKQNVVDVFVFAFVLVVARRRDRRGRRAAAFAGGSAAVLAVALAGAAARGTSPVDLWDALVVFRFEASAVIGSSASEATSARLSDLALAFVGSGAAAVLLVSVVHLLRAVVATRHGRREAAGALPVAGGDLTWPALALVTWELVGVALGGSYWLHYLTGLVPGVVVLVSLARPARGRFVLLGACVAYTAVASLAMWGEHVLDPPGGSSDALVESYLRVHAAPTDGVVVGFGHPDIVLGSGLASPYPQLWSLPVRVRDPRLKDLQAVMSGTDPPRWVVVADGSLASWGLDARAAQQYLERHYAEQATFGDWHVWEREPQRPEGKHR